jgi:[acyl-carrier-protein] S-malonyltransferase
MKEVSKRMGKLAFIFPGQGSQFVGMGQDFIEQLPESADFFKKADERLDFGLSDIILKGPEEMLTRTENTQPALLTVSSAILNLLQKEGIKPDFVAGHSLGEYSALVAAGALSFEEAVYAVRMRGLFMEEAVPAGEGAMAAVLGLEVEALEAVCSQATAESSTVQLANLNSPGQIVISGTKEGVERASELAKEKGAKRVIPLNVSGPFHSSLMKPAAEKLAAVLDELSIQTAQVPVIANVTALPVTDAKEIKQRLIEQLYSPVRWIEIVEYLLAQGVDTFIEVGPGKVLSGLVKKVDRKAKVYATNDVESLTKTLAELKEEAKA